MRPGSSTLRAGRQLTNHSRITTIRGLVRKVELTISTKVPDPLFPVGLAYASRQRSHRMFAAVLRFGSARMVSSTCLCDSSIRAYLRSNPVGGSLSRTGPQMLLLGSDSESLL